MNVRRGDLRDVYAENGRAAVFVGDQVIVLSEIASAILDIVPGDGAVSLDEITRAVVAEFGAPDAPLDAQDLTRRHVLDLVAHHVLTDDAATLDEPFTPESVAALRDALRHVVMGEHGPWQLPDRVTGAQFAAAAERHRVVPSVCRALAVLSVPQATAATLAAATLQETATVRRLSDELAEIVTALESAGVRVLAFKGLALAAQAHHDVSSRGTGDHDLLVAPSDVEHAHRVLVSSGWVPATGYPSPGGSWAWRRLVRDYYELSLERDGGSAIDLHWHLGPVRNAFPSFDVLWSRRASVSIGGGEIPTLSAYDALAHSATHSAKDHWRWLRGLLDVRLLMSDSSVWESADRPLRHDQLLTLGLAARLFGVPAGAPPVVHEAVRMAAGVWDTAVARQAGPSHVDIDTRVPGVGLYRALIALGRAGADTGDLRRQLSLSLVPLTTTADRQATSAWVAVPRVTAHRAAEVTRLWRDAIERCDRAWITSRDSAVQ